jgi:glycosyltransferase involved in cell wall biosynthesis
LQKTLLLPDHKEICRSVLYTELGKIPILLMSGRLPGTKRVDLRIRAAVFWKIFSSDSVDVRGWTVREPLLRFPQNVSQRQFSGSFVYNQSLKEKFDHADLFVLPGTGGLAIQQAMASGLPVIAAEADGTQNDLIRSDNGVLIRAGDLDHLVQTIRNLLSDPIRLRKMGEASFRIVHDEINLESMTGTFIEAIHSVKA